MARSLLALAQTNGAKAQNEKWLNQDLNYITNQAGKLRITIAMNMAIKVEVTLDGGSNWLFLNSDTTIPANSLFIFDVPVRLGDKFNLRTQNPAGVNVIVCRIDQVITEG
jgi:hypothetical protein